MQAMGPTSAPPGRLFTFTMLLNDAEQVRALHLIRASYSFTNAHALV